jgi:hypothetical protein
VVVYTSVSTLVFAQEVCVKWYNYLACFFAGAFFIHIVPHVLNGMSAINVIGVLVSLGAGCLMLWAGKFSLRKPWTVVLFLFGIAAVLIFSAHHFH